jgi:DNA-binding SARP family transcriptional activator
MKNMLITRLTPPPQQARLLNRPRIDTLLATVVADYPIGLLIAPAGGGKTTALAALAQRGGWRTAWCRAAPDDTPTTLAAYIAAACATLLPAPGATAQPAGDDAMPHAAIDRLANKLATALDDEAILIIDDAQHAFEDPLLCDVVERLIAALPHRLRLLLATRYTPASAVLRTAIARGEAHIVDAAALAFTREETHDFQALAGRTDAQGEMSDHHGWPIAVQLLAATGDPAALIEAYVEHEILAPQPAPLQQLLLLAAEQRRIDLDACAAAMPVSPELVAFFNRRALFIEQRTGAGLQFHPLIGAALAHIAPHRLQQRAERHRRLAIHAAAQGDHFAAAHHWITAGDRQSAATALNLLAREPLTPVEAQQLIDWIAQLPEEQDASALLLARAAAERALGRFAQAIEGYQRAAAAAQQRGDREAAARALRGCAQCFLDTVQPAQATPLLKRALKLLPAERTAERAEIIRLQAENWANHGRADVALILERAAAGLTSGRPRDPSPPPTEPAPRLLLRSGRLAAARDMLEAAIGVHPSEQRAPGLHREPLLLLALIYAMLGNGPRALALARRGLLEAQQSDSILTEAIAHMRLGHALQVIAPLDAEAAAAHYQRALALIDTAGVARTRAEALLGLALLQGRAGDLDGAEAHALTGIASAAGDDWIAALLWLAIGSSAAAAGDERATTWLGEAQSRFARGGDTYGQAAVALWLAIHYLHYGDEPAAAAQIAALFAAIRRDGYDGLLSGPTLFGPRDQAQILPLLLRARALPEHASEARLLLHAAFPAIATDETIDTYHPGFTLRIRLFGTMRVWRGAHEIQQREWQRDKARQLLQLLLVHRGEWLQREQICALLWPESEPTAAERQFKVTLNALNAALEPRRPTRVNPFFIRRQGLAYAFAPSYGCWIDVDEFELRTAAAQSLEGEAAIRNLRAAEALYQGDFLAEALYDQWTIEERERLLARYLAAAAQLAGLLLARAAYAEVIAVCERIIKRDRVYEEAYQILMRAHARAGSRSQALRCYARCEQALHDELGIAPLPETQELAQQIRQNETP